MKKLLIPLLVLILIASMLSACGSQNNPDETMSSYQTSGTVQTDSSTESTGFVTESIGTSTPTTTDTSTDTPGTDTSVPTTSETKPNVTEPSDPPKTNPPVTTETPTKPTDTTPPETMNPPQTEPPKIEPTYIPSTGISASLYSYNSASEATPYIKGKAIYSILYGGSRAQVGDTLVFSLSVSPANHGDTVYVSATENLSYSLSGNLLTVKVAANNDISTGRITVYTAQSSNSKVNASVKISFVIDAARNPYEDMFTLISRYIEVKGMSNTDVSHGYTSEDPSLSITSYPGAPAWDDQILKSDPDWKENCFWLIDQYASRGFKKVAFIETSASFGFSAAQ